MSTTVSPLESARTELASFGDRLVGPDDARYDEARTMFNAMIDKRPALIALLHERRRRGGRDPLRARRTTCRSPCAAAATTAEASRASTTAS